MVNCINLIIERSPRFILGRENVPCVAEVVNKSLKADCTDYTEVILGSLVLNVSEHCKESSELVNQAVIMRFGHAYFKVLRLRPVLFYFSQIKFL